MALRVRGRVVGGHLRVDIPVELAENTEVELIEAPAADEEELDPELEAALGEAAAEIARGEGSSWEEVRARLHARGPDETLPDPHQPSG